MKKGDRIQSFRGKPAEGPLHLEQELLRCYFDEEVEVEILRGGEVIRLLVKVINYLDYRRSLGEENKEG